MDYNENTDRPFKVMELEGLLLLHSVYYAITSLKMAFSSFLRGASWFQNRCQKMPSCLGLQACEIQPGPDLSLTIAAIFYFTEAGIGDI